MSRPRPRDAARAAETTLAFARALDGRADVCLAVEDVPTWSWSETRVLTAVRRDLLHDPWRARATTVHEMGHAALSRFDVLRPVMDLRHAEEAVLRALEEGRVERWMARRFPGAAPWLAELRAGEAPLIDVHRPRLAVFTNAVLFESTREAIPGADGEDPEVREALERTRTARERALAAVPPVGALAAAELGRRPEVMAHYHANVAPLLVGPRVACPPIELLARVAAAESAAIIIEEVLPAVRRLVDEDIRDVAAHLASREGLRERVRAAWVAAEDLQIVRGALGRLRRVDGDGTIPSRQDEDVARGILERGVEANAQAGETP